jgi:hypothetical protein
MPVYVKTPRGKKKVADYDTTLMLTLNDILPTGREFTKKYLVRKKDAPTGRLRDLYHTKDNGALVRKIFSKCLKVILYEIAAGNCQFIVPNQGPSKPRIYVGYLKQTEVKGKRKSHRLQKFDMLQTDYKIPYIHYSMSPTTLRKPLRIYLNKELYNVLINTANSGKKFSVVPRDLEYFLPYVYQEFSYIQENKLRLLLNVCFRLVQKSIRFGEEVRMIDGDGEVRIFRNLGPSHDEVMRRVVKRRLTVERNKRKELYESIS